VDEAAATLRVVVAARPGAGLPSTTVAISKSNDSRGPWFFQNTIDAVSTTLSKTLERKRYCGWTLVPALASPDWSRDESRTSNILECIELHIDAHHGQMATSRHAGDVRLIVFKPHDTILLFDGSCHWDCYVPAAPIPLLRPAGRGGRN
jgi:hypothetical protein